MSNFPSKWFDFTNHKELKRLRADIKDTFSLKLQIAASVIITIITFFLDKYIHNSSWKIQCLFCVSLCIIVLLIFILPSIIAFLSLKSRCNILIKGKDAVSLFDDEIVYNVLVASEYYNSKEKIPNNELRAELNNFYTLEIQYYLSESIKKLSLFSSSCVTIFGNKKNQISKQRAENIIQLITTLSKQATLSLDKETMEKFDIFCASIKSLEQ